MKKLLALVLALVMTLSLCVTSNAAFADAADIEHDEAVEVMNALGVIVGKGENKFDPKGNVTRAEMAKMITMIMLGDVDVTAFVGTTTDLKDIAGHWAEGYIKYCYSQGVIAGKGNGIFAPNNNVTALEAAKMLCVALGYNANVQGYVGADWAINVVRDAQLSGLYDELSLATSKVLTRDEAAQMIYNAVTAKVIVKSPALNITTGAITYSYSEGTTSLLNDTFGAKTFVGTYVGNYDTGVTGTEKDSIVVNGKLDTSSGGTAPATFPSDMALSNIGEEVKVIFKDGKGGTDGTPDKKDTIYGVYNTGATTVYNITKADIQDVDAANGKIKFGDTKYEYQVGGNIVTNYGGYATVAFNNANLAAMKVDSADAIKFVVDSTTGKIANAYVTAKDFAKVSAVNSENIQVTTFGKLSFEDDVIYDGVAKDDIVMVTKLYDTTAADATYVVEKAELVKGTVNKFYSGKKVAVDGTTYSVSAEAAAVGNYTDGTTALTNAVLDETYEFVLYGKQFVAYKAISETYGNYAVILAATDGDAITGQSVKLLLADGNKATYKISTDSKVGNADLDDAGEYFDVDNIATDVDSATGLGTLVEYKILNDGTVKMVAATTATSNKGTFTKATKVLGYGSNTLTSADAVAFVLFRGEWKVMKASAIGADITGTIKDVQYKLNSVGDRVLAFAIQATSAVSSATTDYLYAYINTYANSYTKDSKTYTDVDVLNAAGETVTLTFENDLTANAKLARNTFIRYKLGANDKVAIGDVTQVNTFGRVSDYDADRNLIVISGTTYPVAKNAVIMNVNTNKKTAGSLVGITEADPVNTTYQNVAFITDTVDSVPNTVVAVFVDDDLKMNTASAVTLGAPTAAQVEAALAGASSVTVTGTLPTGVTVPAGKTLTVETLDNAITVKGTLVLNKNVAYDLSKITGDVDAVVKFTSTVATNVSNAGSFYTAAAATPTALVTTATTNVTGKTYKYVANVDTDAAAGAEVPGFLLQ